MKEIDSSSPWMHSESACCSRVVPSRGQKMRQKNEEKKTFPLTCWGIKKYHNTPTRGYTYLMSFKYSLLK